MRVHVEVPSAGYDQRQHVAALIRLPRDVQARQADAAGHALLRLPHDGAVGLVDGPVDGRRAFRLRQQLGYAVGEAPAVAHAVGVVKGLAVKLLHLRRLVYCAWREVVDRPLLRDGIQHTVRQAQARDVQHLAAVPRHRHRQVGHDVADVAAQAHRRTVSALVQDVAVGRCIVQRVIALHRDLGAAVRRHDAVHLVAILLHHLLLRHVRQEGERLGPAALTQPRQHVIALHIAQECHAALAAAVRDLLPQQGQRVRLRGLILIVFRAAAARQYQQARSQQQCPYSFHRFPLCGPRPRPQPRAVGAGGCCGCCVCSDYIRSLCKLQSLIAPGERSAPSGAGIFRLNNSNAQAIKREDRSTGPLFYIVLQPWERM